MKTTTKRRPLLVLVSLLTVACMILLTFPAYAEDGWNGTDKDTTFEGNGTKESPWLISTPAELAGFADLVRADSTYSTGKYFKLTNGIDLNGKSFLPIGTGGKGFYGNFDGNNKTVSNFKIEGQGVHTGLFSNLSAATVIKNLTVTNATLNGSQCGGIVGIASGGLIENCHTSNLTFVGATYAGGIMGRLGAGNLTIRNCTSSVNQTFSNLTGTLSIGGIIGATGTNNGDAKAVIENCSTTFVVTNNTVGKSINAGGILGYNDISTVSNSEATAKDELTISGCNVNMTVTTATGSTITPMVGGIVGFSALPAASAQIGSKFAAKINVTNCNVAGTVTTDNARIVAGILTQAYGEVNVSGCNTNVDITATGNSAKTDDTGLSGLIGLVHHGSVTIEDSASFGDITLTNDVSGVCAGSMIAIHKTAGMLTLTNCRSAGSISVSSASGDSGVLKVGGMVGNTYNVGLNLTNCIVETDVSINGATGQIEASGIVASACGTVGDILFKSSTGKDIQRFIDNCIYAGDLYVKSGYTGSDRLYIGGIAGRLQNVPEIKDTKMYGTVAFEYSGASNLRAGVFVGAYAYGGYTTAIIDNSFCIVPEGGTLGDTADETTQNNTYTENGKTMVKLDAVGGAAGMTNVDIVLAPSTADIAISLEGVQWTTPVDFDHDNNADTPAVKANDVRFVATLGDAAVTEEKSVLSKYSSVGFMITAVYGTDVYDFSQELNYVYTAIKAAGTYITAADLGGDYLVAITGRNIPAAADDTVTFYVTPVLTPIDGTGVVYGETVAIVFVGGVYQPSAQS